MTMRENSWTIAALSILPLWACAPAGATGMSAPQTAPTSVPASHEPADVATTPADESNEPVVAFSSDASMQRLSRSTEKVDFFKLSNQYEGQQNLAMCGPTSAVIVLNTLRAENEKSSKPSDPSLFPQEFATGLPPGLDLVFHRYSQGMFFKEERVTKVKARETFYGKAREDGQRDPGMQLRQLHEIFLGLGAHSELHVVDDKVSIDDIRQALRENMANADDYAIVNYYRPVLDQKGGGHISPLAAYDEVSDSFLVLDVNPNNGKTWVWVRTDKLVEAMRTFDTVENRGFLLVHD